MLTNSQKIAAPFPSKLPAMGQELVDYLAVQFPATDGHLPLTEKIRAIWREGMLDAADIVSGRRELLEKNHCKDTIREICAEVDIRAAAADPEPPAGAEKTQEIQRPKLS